MDTKQLRQWIAEGDTERVLDVMVNDAALDTDLHDAVTLLSARHSRLALQKSKGTITQQEAGVALAQVNEDLLELIKQVEAPGPTMPGRHRRRIIGFLVAVILLLGGAAWALSLFTANDDAAHENTPYFQSPDKLNILIIPFHGFDACDKAAPCDNAFMQGIYRLGEDDIEISVLENFTPKYISNKLIDSLIQATQSDIIVWGDYEKPVCDVDSTKIYLNYKIRSGIPYLYGINEADNEEIISPLLDVATGKILGTLEELVYWLLASNECYKGNNEKALMLFDKIDMTKNLDDEIYQGLLLHKGVLNIELGRSDEAIQYLTLLLSIDSLSVWANGNLAVHYYNKKDYNQALRYARKIENLNTPDPQYFNLYELLMELSVKTDQGCNKITRYANMILLFDPANTRANQVMAACYYDTGAYDVAMQYMMKARNPQKYRHVSSIPFYTLKARLFFFHSKYDSSFYYYKLIYEIDSKSEMLDIDKLKGLTIADNHMRTRGYTLSDLKNIEQRKGSPMRTYDLGFTKFEMPPFVIVNKKEDNSETLKMMYDLKLLEPESR